MILAHPMVFFSSVQYDVNGTEVAALTGKDYQRHPTHEWVTMRPPVAYCVRFHIIENVVFLQMNNNDTFQSQVQVITEPGTQCTYVCTKVHTNSHQTPVVYLSTPHAHTLTDTGISILT